jgi:hypothetical protein
MSDRSDFVSNPVKFLEKHILRCQFFDGGVDIAESRPHVVTIKEMKNSPAIVNSTGGKVWYLTTDTSGCALNEKAPIFWVGYRKNDVTPGMLTNASRLMFTANMDGCTLGVGSQGGDGACLVMHANKASAGATGGRPAQALAQHGQLASGYGGSDFWSVEPSAYMDGMGATGVFKATNFGVNQGGWWFFYSHSWMQLSGSTSGSYAHGGTREATFVPG